MLTETTSQQYNTQHLLATIFNTWLGLGFHRDYNHENNKAEYPANHKDSHIIPVNQYLSKVRGKISEHFLKQK